MNKIMKQNLKAIRAQQKVAAQPKRMVLPPETRFVGRGEIAIVVQGREVQRIRKFDRPEFSCPARWHSYCNLGD
jgi:hypothetical protein